MINHKYLYYEISVDLVTHDQSLQIIETSDLVDPNPLLRSVTCPVLRISRVQVGG